MTPQDALRLYLSLKAHFSDSNYDFHKYGGQIRWGEKTFQNRRDKLLLQAICRTTNEEQWTARIVANALREGKVPYLDKLMTDEAVELGEAQVKRWRDPQESFKAELRVIRKRWAGSLDDLVFSKNRGVIPNLIKYYWMTLISADTIIGFDKALNVISKVDTLLNGDIVWDRNKTLLKQYRGFVQLDKNWCTEQIYSAYQIESALATTK